MKEITSKNKLITVLTALSITTVSNGIIDFEAEGALFGDDYSVPPTYKFSDGNFDIRFGVDPDGIANGLVLSNPMKLEARGTDAFNAFLNNTSGIRDVESTHPGAQLGYNGGLGNYFLRNRSLEEGGTSEWVNNAAFVIRYSSTSTGTAFSASGEIWDIDGNSVSKSEQWIITAYHGPFDNLVQIGQIITPEYTNFADATSLNGQAFTFAFDSLPQSIDWVTIQFSGTKTSGIGLAFDNFKASSVPEPSTYAAILGILAVGLALKKRKSTK